MKANCDRDCLNCPYPEMPKRCESLPVTQWEWDVLRMVHRDPYHMSEVKPYGCNTGIHIKKQAHIVEVRKAYGLSQKDLARAVGRSQTTICEWEKGRVKADWDRLCSVLPELEQYRSM